jgi:hypothetical protein
MNSTCVLHPTRPAHWTCPKCNSQFCSTCIVKRDKGGYQAGQFLYLCPKCFVPANWVGASNFIKPFWQVLPKFFTYPFSLWPLGLNIVLCIALLVFSGSGFFGAIISFLIWGILLKYSFSALTTTANGDLRPPPVNAETISEIFSQVFKQLAIYLFCFIGFLVITTKFGVFLGMLFLLFALLFIPAMIILLVATNSFFQAINPILFTRLAMRIGWSYLLMYLFLIMLGTAPAYLLSFFLKNFPPKTILFLSTFVKNYYTIISG